MSLLGRVPSPLAVAMRRSSPLTARAEGYQSVGMKPMGRCRISRGPDEPKAMVAAGSSCVVSKTAIASNEESATKRYLPSEDCASAVGELPAYFFGDGQVERSRISTRALGPGSAVGTASTLSELERATYNICSSGLSSIAVGCEPGARGSFGCFRSIRFPIFPLVRSSSATCEAFHKLHQARLASRVATQV